MSEERSRVYVERGDEERMIRRGADDSIHSILDERARRDRDRGKIVSCFNQSCLTSDLVPYLAIQSSTIS